MRIVLDTNVLLAAFAARGLCEGLLAAILQSHTLIFSEHILGEFSTHAARKLKLPRPIIQELQTMLRSHAELVVPDPLDVQDCRDRDDWPVWGTATAARAEALVTGDAELLALGHIHNIPIRSPRAMYDQLRTKHPGRG